MSELDSTPEDNILLEAATIIYGDREETYGHPAKNLNNIASLWAEYINQNLTYEDGKVMITAEDVCWMMVLLKMARQMNSSKRDNLVDAAGYIALIERLG